MLDARAGHRAFLHVEKVAGRGEQTIVLLHGGGVGGWMWQPLVDELDGAATLVIPDLPGHDRSADSDYSSHAETLEALIGVVESCGGAAVTVVGFSLGAQLAVLLASHRPDLVNRVVVISAQAQPTRWPMATLALLRLAAPLARNERFARAQAGELFIPPALISEYLRTSRSLSTATLLASVGENIRFTVPPGWSAFAGEALILAGAKERKMMRASAATLAATSAHGSAEIVDGAGHGVPLTHAAWLAERLGRWMS